MAWTESGCSNPLTAGTKNDAGILCRSSSARMRGNPRASRTRPAQTARDCRSRRAVGWFRCRDRTRAQPPPVRRSARTSASGHDRPARGRPARAPALRSTSRAESPAPARTRRCRREERTESRTSWKNSRNVSIDEGWYRGRVGVPRPHAEGIASKRVEGVAAPSLRKPTVACWAPCRGSGTPEPERLISLPR